MKDRCDAAREEDLARTYRDLCIPSRRGHPRALMIVGGTACTLLASPPGSTC